MGILDVLRNKLRDPRLENVDINSSDLIKTHLTILNEKAMLQAVFQEFYDTCINLDKRFFQGQGSAIEIGAGTSFFKKSYPHVISTDIMPSVHLDRTLDMQQMDLPDESVRAFYGINCFHHLLQPRKFFAELTRTLIPGGGVVLIEPYYGLFVKLLYPYIHAQEHFDPKQKEWESLRDPRHIMLDANQALSYIILVRDRCIFEKEFPELEIVYQKTLHNSLRYLLSGGVNFKQLIPNWMLTPVKIIEKITQPLEPVTALHFSIVIRRRQVMKK